MEGGMARKRKAASQDGELSKRLKKLNILERDGQTLHIPLSIAPTSPPPKPASLSLPPPLLDDDLMQLDNTKYKVYIHDIDDELSDSESDDGKLVFLPDIEKHIRNMQVSIPRSLMPKSDEGGKNQQLVLYGVPSSLTLPEEKDSVRKAIIETRARARDQARMDGVREAQTNVAPASASGIGSSGVGRAIAGSSTAAYPVADVPMEAVADVMAIDDPDAMDLS